MKIFLGDSRLKKILDLFKEFLIILEKERQTCIFYGDFLMTSRSTNMDFKEDDYGFSG